VCALLGIPFVVIVQGHLLKEKGSVRLRRVLAEDLEIGWNVNSSATNELFVSIEELSSTIRDMAKEGTSVPDERNGQELNHDANGGLLVRENSITRSSAAQIECFYIHEDQYFSDSDHISKTDTPHFKTILKAMKSVAQRSEAYLGSQLNSQGFATPVFGVSDLPFWVLRDFGTALMKRERKEKSAIGASLEITEAYPRGKRSLKALAMSIDNFMKRRGLWESNSRHESSPRETSHLLNFLLYSKIDDRFDLVSLEGNSNASNGHQGMVSRSGRR